MIITESIHTTLPDINIKNIKDCHNDSKTNKKQLFHADNVGVKENMLSISTSKHPNPHIYIEQNCRTSKCSSTCSINESSILVSPKNGDGLFTKIQISPRNYIKTPKINVPYDSLTPEGQTEDIIKYKACIEAKKPIDISIPIVRHQGDCIDSSYSGRKRIPERIEQNKTINNESLDLKDNPIPGNNNNNNNNRFLSSKRNTKTPLHPRYLSPHFYYPKTMLSREQNPFTKINDNIDLRNRLKHYAVDISGNTRYLTPLSNCLRNTKTQFPSKASLENSIELIKDSSSISNSSIVEEEKLIKTFDAETIQSYNISSAQTARSLTNEEISMNKISNGVKVENSLFQNSVLSSNVFINAEESLKSQPSQETVSPTKTIFSCKYGINTKLEVDDAMISLSPVKLQKSSRSTKKSKKYLKRHKQVPDVQPKNPDCNVVNDNSYSNTANNIMMSLRMAIIARNHQLSPLKYTDAKDTHSRRRHGNYHLTDYNINTDELIRNKGPSRIIYPRLHGYKIKFHP